MEIHIALNFNVQMSIVITTVECHALTFASLTSPLALLASLSCFTLRLKPRKTGIALHSSMCETRRN
jgi:hypothetical protein